MMKRCFVIAAALSVFAVCSVYAQGMPSAAASGMAPSAANGIKQSYKGIKTNLMKAADKMPEDGYSFQPTKEERNFGGWVAHVADAQTGICSGIAGTPTTINAASKTTKADLVAALKQSFDTCDAVYDGLTSANAADAVPFFRGKQARLDAL